jgi:CRP-like cAMP-binding protein
VRIDTESRGLLDRLPAADRAELERRGTRRRYRAGAPLFHEGDPPDWVAVVLGGRVEVSAVTGDGKEVVLAVCSSGDVLGEVSAIDGLSRSATATAVDTVEALVVPVDGFRGVPRGQPNSVAASAAVDRRPVARRRPP